MISVQLPMTLAVPAAMFTGVMVATTMGTTLAVSRSADSCYPPGVTMPRRLGGNPFKSLDEYLAYRKKLGQIDYPYYEAVGPELYRCIVYHQPATDAPPQVFTRAELARKYGFEE